RSAAPDSRASEPDRHEQLEDIRAERVERLAARGAEVRIVRGPQRIARIAEGVVGELDAIVEEVHGPALDEAPAGAGELVGRAEPERLARERRDLLVTAEEILLVAPLEQVAVEVGVILGIEPIVRLEGPFAPRMGVADLERVGADAPGIREETVAAVQR